MKVIVRAIEILLDYPKLMLRPLPRRTVTSPVHVTRHHGVQVARLEVEQEARV